MPPLGAKAATTQPNTRCIQHSSNPLKKLEVHGLGADAKAKQALTIQEVYKQLQMLCAVGLEKNYYSYTIEHPPMAL